MRRALIIEDSEEQAALAMRLLRKEGIVCILAATFEEGMERDRESDFDCIILDADLPDISSPFDTVSKIRDFRAPVVVWTGCQDQTLIRAVRQTGASYVSKPGADLLVEKVWSQMNYKTGAADSELGQQEAQKRIQEASLKETTPVTLSLSRVFIIVGAIIAGTFTITNVVLSKVGGVDTKLSQMGAELAKFTASSDKRQDSFDASQKEEKAETQKRVREWSKWRYGVSHDLKRIGEAVKVPIETNPDLDP